MPRISARPPPLLHAPGAPVRPRAVGDHAPRTAARFCAMAAANCRSIRRASGGGVGERGGVAGDEGGGGGVDDEPGPSISSSSSLMAMFRSGTVE